MEKMQEIRPQVGVAVCVLQHNQILLGKRRSKLGSGSWSVCGGHLEHGEEVFECARRELLEETGLQAEMMRSGPWQSNMIDGKHYITIYVFVDSFSGSIENPEPDKCEGWHWFSDESIPEPLFPTVASLLQRYKSIKNLSCSEVHV